MHILLHPDMEKGEVHHTYMLAELQHKDELLTPEYNIHARIMQRSPIPLCSFSARNSLPLHLAPGLCHGILKERESKHRSEHEREEGQGEKIFKQTPH